MWAATQYYTRLSSNCLTQKYKEGMWQYEGYRSVVLCPVRYCVMCDDINSHKLHPNFTFLLTKILYIALLNRVLSLILFRRVYKIAKSDF